MYETLKEFKGDEIMKEQLAKKFSIISGVLALLFLLSMLGIVASQISWSSSNLGLLFSFYVMLGWIPALLCSIAGIVFSILVKIDTFYMPKLHFCISVVSLFISGYWGFYVIKTAVRSALR